jgi:hypothetical protein
LFCFQIETPSIPRKGVSHKAEREEVDGAVGGSDPCLHYSLFLPDPESVERLGSAPVETVYESLKSSNGAENSSVVVVDPTSGVLPPNPSIVVVDPKSVVRPIDASDLIQGSVKTRRRAGASDKRVVIDDSPPRVRQISPQPFSRFQRHKTFAVRNLLIFVIS